MTNPSRENTSIAFSVDVYRLLLAAYPKKFRQEYGAQMLQFFQDCCIRVYQQRGPLGMLWLWTITLFDFLHTVVEEHLQSEVVTMVKNRELVSTLMVAVSIWLLLGLEGGLFPRPNDGVVGVWIFLRVIIIILLPLSRSDRKWTMQASIALGLLLAFWGYLGVTIPARFVLNGLAGVFGILIAVFSFRAVREAPLLREA